jgi:hypothetical protein
MQGRQHAGQAAGRAAQHAGQRSAACRAAQRAGQAACRAGSAACRAGSMQGRQRSMQGRQRSMPCPAGWHAFCREVPGRTHMPPWLTIRHQILSPRLAAQAKGSHGKHRITLGRVRELLCPDLGLKGQCHHTTAAALVGCFGCHWCQTMQSAPAPAPPRRMLPPRLPPLLALHGRSRRVLLEEDSTTNNTLKT